MAFSRRIGPRLAAAALAALAPIGLEAAAGAPKGAMGAAPELRAAKALDADRDGSIDGFSLKFSSTLRGRTRSKAPFGVRVGGYEVIARARPKGRTLRVSVAERPECDLGARPRVNVQGAGLTGRGGRRVRRSRVTAGRKPRGAPRIVCAVTADGDRDGRLDGLVLTYSTKVRNRAQSTGRLPFRVDRYSVSSVGRARGRNIVLSLRERDEFDSGALPAVIYRQPRAKRERRYAVRSGRRLARSSTFNSTRDRAVPQLLSTSTADANHNGSVDGLAVRFSEPVRAARGAVRVDGATVTSLPADERELIGVGLAEGPLGSAARPNLILGADDSLRDSSGNPTGPLSSRADDDAAPVIVSARTVDGGGAKATLDGVEVAFSEPVTHPIDADGSYPFSVGGYSVTGASAAAGPSVTLSVSEAPAPDGGARPAVGYVRGAGAPVLDAAGNEAVTRTFDPTGDGVAPMLVAAATLDGDVDGVVDGVRFDFSEPIVHAAQGCPGCSFSLEGYTALLAGAASGSSVIVNVDERTVAGNPIATYAPVGAGVVDPAGNPAAGGSVPTGDQAPPVVVGARTADADADGRIDRLNLTFSEAVGSAADTAAPFSFAAAGYEVERVGAAAGRELAIALKEGDAPDTGAAPAVSYRSASGSQVTDLSGTEHANRSYPGLTRDDAAPVFIEARTADAAPAEGNGRLDAVDLVFSEQLAGGAGTFDVGGRGGETVSVLEDRVRVSFVEGATLDTASELSVGYTPGDLADVPEGPADTPSPASAVNAQALDGAGPVIVGTRTGDVDPVDGVLDRMEVELSEPVAYLEGVEPVISLGAPPVTVTGASASGATLTARLSAPSGPPRGDLLPTVTVSAPDRLTDAAGNPARTGAFSGAVDGVAPVLVAARTGEEAGALCEDRVVNGRVDCFRAEWSEAVSQPSSANVFTGSFTPTGLMTTDIAPYSDVRVTEGADPDRNESAQISYSGGGDVADLAGNPALASPAPIATVPACNDPVDEPNDSSAEAKVLRGSAGRPQRLCAFDEDWFLVTPEDGRIQVLVDSDEPLAPHVELHGSSSGLLATQAGGPGSTVIVEAPAPDGQTYFLRVIAVEPSQEGPYCVDATPTEGEDCLGGQPPV